MNVPFIKWTSPLALLLNSQIYRKVSECDPFIFVLSSYLIMQFDSGFNEYKKKKGYRVIPSGDTTLDELLKGGFQRDLIYLLYGDKKKTSKILWTTSVIAQKAILNDGLGKDVKIAYIDANNYFNPYDISKYALRHRLSPREVLENIIIARAFTWEQMVEILENRLSKLENIKMVLISGITTLFQSYEKQTFEDLLYAIDGIKKMLMKSNPYLILTAPLNEFSEWRPEGGKIIAHFGSVLVLIRDQERLTEYNLVQHPYLAETVLKKFKPREAKLSKPTRNTTLDCWIK
jgi:hypothetical protein